MRKFLLIALISIPLVCEPASVPNEANVQTKSGLYVTAKEAFLMKSAPGGRRVVLIDVRDPAEIMFTGSTPITDIYVPYVIIDNSSFDARRQRYRARINPRFVRDTISKLTAIGAAKDSHIIFMCRSGASRSAPAANLLFEQGYRNVYSMVDGFQGDKIKNGPNRGRRLKNGWINSSLPWVWGISANKAYLVRD